CVLRWEDEADMLAMANASPYGLGGGVWTRDIYRAQRLARSINTGIVWINRYYNFFPGQPLGGVKESGFGREGCLETLDHYTQIKSIVFDERQGPLGLFGA